MLTLRILAAVSLSGLFLACVLLAFAERGGAASENWLVAALLTGLAALAGLLTAITGIVRRRQGDPNQGRLASRATSSVAERRDVTVVVRPRLNGRAAERREAMEAEARR